jgi:hypothetical protein
VCSQEDIVTVEVGDKPATKDFPLAAVQSCLLAELTMLAETEAQIRGIELPKGPAALIKMAVPLDSLSVVDVLCAVEPIIGFESKDSLVRTGGYPSIEAAMDHLLPRLEAAWKKHNGVKA